MVTPLIKDSHSQRLFASPSSVTRPISGRIARSQVDKEAIACILDTWLGQYSRDFFQPPEFPCLKMLLAYMALNMPGSDLERHTQLLLSQLQHLEPTEPEAGAPAPQQDPEPQQELAPAATVVPAAASEPELAEPITAAGAQQSDRAAIPLAMAGPVQLVVTALIHSPELGEPAETLPVPEVEQGPAPATGVAAGPEQPPASVEEPALAPEQQLVLAAAPKDAFAFPVVALFVILVCLIPLYCGLIYFVL
ncbi:ral guanine nucleotide dissociation stimulator-like [Ursus americanus]|uniref:ral guanine nucleotide dissociation stimulator-like n=1 Tax=Ursus americanus TaxID=9643 RepID=UPI001E67CFCE|nr:ral guanine nucleotide dissociation stimulator-like [Ursus americanus]